MRWYCWIIFCMIASLSALTLAADNDVADIDETNLLLVESENENIDSMIEEKGLMSDNDEDEDDDDDEFIGGDDSLAITDRHLRQRKPQKGKENKDKSSSDEDDKDDKDGKKSKKTKCICYRKKSHRLHLRKRPHWSGKHRPSSADKNKPSSSHHDKPSSGGHNKPSSADHNKPSSSSSSPSGQGNKNPSGCKTVASNFVSSIKNILSTFAANTHQRP